MIKAIILWLLRWLEESLDTGLKADIEAYEARKAELEAKRNALLDQTVGLTVQIEQLQAKREQLDAELGRQIAAADETETKITEVLYRKPEPVSNADALRDPL